ncbi:MAG: flagellar hook-basal body complex protein FliE [Rhodospirillales bacterium]|nr:flagellar hook-basal body complex protein FliE [Rhodospirillales bacterium]
MAIAPLQNAASAASAYAKAPQGGSLGLNPRDTQATPFADMVKGALKQAINVQKTSETVSMAAITDRADMNEVITSVAEAEATLHAVTSIRDKIIDAYREILRMPV